MSQLALADRFRDRSRLPWRDYRIDGRLLSEALGEMDHVAGLGWQEAAAEEAYLDRLVLEAEADWPSGRVSLYVCGECADPGCGVYAVRVRRTPGGIEWSDFALEVPYLDEPMATFPELGPYLFEEAAYRAVLGRGELP